jgi:hypothetical protein
MDTNLKRNHLASKSGLQAQISILSFACLCSPALLIRVPALPHALAPRRPVCI